MNAPMSTSVPPPGWTGSSQTGTRAADAPPVAPSPAGVRLGGSVRGGPGPRFKLLGGGAVVAALAGLAFVLLGSSGTQFDPIAQAASISALAPGYRMHMTIDISAASLGGSITGEGDGVVDLRDRAASMSVVMNLPDLPQVTQALGGTTMAMQMRMLRTTLYFKFPAALTSKLPYDRPWLKIDLGRLLRSEGMSSLTSLVNNPVSSDPASQLRYLRATSGDVVDEGPAMVDGVLTTHYRAAIDFNRVADMVPASERAATREAMAKLITLMHASQLPVDVWVDHSKYVRREEMTLNIAIPSRPVLQELVTADFSDYGPQPEPTAPPADQVQDVTPSAPLGG